MFIKYILIVCWLRTVFAYQYNDDLIDFEIFTNLKISSFLDGKRNIRLNLTWTNVTDTVDQISIRFVDTDDSICSAIDGVERLSIGQETTLIFPPLSLSNPADNLANGCKYEVVVESHDLKPNLKQSVMYQIPDCVQDKCKCRKKSPYRLSSIVLVHEDVYFVKWSKLFSDNLTLLDVYYLRENNSTALTQVKQINGTDDGAAILLPDLIENISYKITVRFSYDGCIYRSWITLKVPPKQNTWYIVLVLALTVVFITLFLFTITMSSEKLRAKLKKYKRHVFCWDYEEAEDIYAIRPLSQSVMVVKEEINSQYTPLEFALNSYRYGKFEFPRNKIVIKEEIGKGAFGTVCYGEAFELNNNPGYTRVAVKQLREGAPDEEKQDLLNEIEILKKVGEHKNIVKLLGCVTISQPYMMILELAPCGSLKKYLLKLREKWSKRKSRFFFDDDVLENWNPNRRMESDTKLNYTKVVFETTDDSYITPDNLSLDAVIYTSENDAANMEYISKYLTPNKIRRVSEKSQGPQSPTSVASSGLLSCADTEVTTLSSLPPTPEVKEIQNEYVQKVEPVLDNEELQQFALQIARGMEYLEQIKVTHRDLAARNVLMANDKVLKISDFGLSRVGTYVSKKGQKLPLRWMSIEAIEEKTCTHKSDVWSFGVVLWEIGTLGAFPYPKTHDNLVLYDLKMGKRLERPKICTDELYQLMIKCWNEKPDDRPKFSEIVDQLHKRNKKIYVDFEKLSPAYVFPPSQEPESTSK